MTPSWSRSLLASFGTFLVLVLLVGAVQIRLDPLGIWNSPVVAGLNQAKPQQRGVERLLKPYQHADARPEVLFFGTSRVSHGIPATWPGVPDAEVYNFGLNASRMDEAMRAVRHAVAVQKPRVVVIGVDPGMFVGRKTDEKPLRWGWDPWRDRAIRHGFGPLFKLRDGVFSIDALEGTRRMLEESAKHPEAVYFERGTRIDKASLPHVDRMGWRERMFTYTRDYEHLRPQPAMVELLGETVRALRATGVTVHVVFVPDHADLIAVWRTHPEAWRRLAGLKRALARETRFLDVYQVMGWTRRRKNFRDVAHLNRRIGEGIVRRLNGGDGPGTWITVENVHEEVQKQADNVDAYLRKEPGLAAFLRSPPKERAAFEAALTRVRPWLR